MPGRIGRGQMLRTQAGCTLVQEAAWVLHEGLPVFSQWQHTSLISPPPMGSSKSFATLIQSHFLVTDSGGISQTWVDMGQYSTGRRGLPFASRPVLGHHRCRNQDIVDPIGRCAREASTGEDEGDSLWKAKSEETSKVTVVCR